MLALVAQAVEATSGLGQRRRGGRAANPHAARSLVDQVDGFIRQESITDISRRQLRSGDESVVVDFQHVVFFVTLADAFENLNRFLDGRFAHNDRLEAALKRCVPLNMLAVFVERRCSDRLNLTACESRFEDVGGIDRAFGGAGTDEHVQFVDKEDAISCGLELFDDLLQSFLELTAILRARHEVADVQGHKPLVAQRLGDVTRRDSLGEELSDSGLTNARLAHEDRIILGAPGEDLNHALELG